MQKSTFLKVLIITLSIVFLTLQLFAYEFYATGVSAALMVLLTALYCYNVKKRRLYFFIFLLLFTLAKLLDFASWFIEVDLENGIDYPYYLVNILFITSYSFLIAQILNTMDLKKVIKKFPFHILILLVLDVFCVSVVTGTAKPQLSVPQYSLEFIYNGIIMILLSLALINYIYRDDKKSMNLLVGSIFIVFSEVIQLAYFYISDINILNVIYSFFLVIAFFFFYLQSRLLYDKKVIESRQDLTT